MKINNYYINNTIITNNIENNYFVHNVTYEEDYNINKIPILDFNLDTTRYNTSLVKERKRIYSIIGLLDET